MTAAGLLHSDICGSMAICASPQLFAACRVLRRQISPRHPPYALSILTYVRFTLAFFFSAFEFLLVRKKIFLVKSFLRFFLLYSFQRTAPVCQASGIGGDEENRTPDPLLARQVLSQLSYAPIRTFSLTGLDLSMYPVLIRCFFFPPLCPFRFRFRVSEGLWWA